MQMRDPKASRCFIKRAMPVLLSCTLKFTRFRLLIYRVIRNLLIHFTKSAHLNGGKECNLRPSDGQTSSR